MQILSKFIYKLKIEHLYYLFCSKYKYSPQVLPFDLHFGFLVFIPSSFIKAGKTSV